MLEILGVHPIEASEPVHLIDVAFSAPFSAFDADAITHSDPALSRDLWQAAYDERELPPLPDGRTRVVFFFHYLIIDQPLLTQDGSVPLPAPIPLPSDLQHIQYDAP